MGVDSAGPGLGASPASSGAWQPRVATHQNTILRARGIVTAPVFHKVRGATRTAISSGHHNFPHAGLAAGRAARSGACAPITIVGHHTLHDATLLVALFRLNGGRAWFSLVCGQRKYASGAGGGASATTLRTITPNGEIAVIAINGAREGIASQGVRQRRANVASVLRMFRDCPPSAVHTATACLRATTENAPLGNFTVDRARTLDAFLDNSQVAHTGSSTMLRVGSDVPALLLLAFTARNRACTQFAEIGHRTVHGARGSNARLRLRQVRASKASGLDHFVLSNVSGPGLSAATASCRAIAPRTEGGDFAMHWALRTNAFGRLGQMRAALPGQNSGLCHISLPGPDSSGSASLGARTPSVPRCGCAILRARLHVAGFRAHERGASNASGLDHLVHGDLVPQSCGSGTTLLGALAPISDSRHDTVHRARIQLAHVDLTEFRRAWIATVKLRLLDEFGAR